MLPYFIRAEDNLSFSNEYHGVGGPLKVSDQKSTHKLTHAWLQACQQAGIPVQSRLQRRGAGRMRALSGHQQGWSPIERGYGLSAPG